MIIEFELDQREDELLDRLALARQHARLASRAEGR